MARQSTVEDLLHISSRLSWRTNLGVAAASALTLHLVASALSAPATVTNLAGLGPQVARGFVGTLAYLFQFLVPLVFLLGAVGSYVRRSHSTALLERASAGGPASVATMSWPQFERLIGEAFRRHGFEVRETGGPTADGGVDLVLTKDGKRYLVECKHWKVQSVGVGVVRELNGVVAAQGAAGGYVVTSGSFTREAWAFAQSCSIELIDGEKFGSTVRGIVPKDREEGVSASQKRAVEGAPCPKCGSAMVRRTAKQGAHAGEEFWGCRRYPGCRGIRSIL